MASQQWNLTTVILRLQPLHVFRNRAHPHGESPRNKLEDSFSKCVHLVPQVIQFSSPDFLPVQDLDFFDVWRVTEQKKGKIYDMGYILFCTTLHV
jgi:hypothetical protein